MSTVFYNSRSTKVSGSSLNQSQKVKPFCKVCYDSGKPESAFNSHFVRETRDVNSRVVCPTLLALACRFCGARGHTVSKCKKAATLQNAPVKAPIDYLQNNNRIMAVHMVKKNLTGAFDALTDEHDDDDADDLSTVFPMLEMSYPCTPPRNNENSYASILMRAPVKKVPDASFYDCETSVSTENTIATNSSKLSIAQRLRMGESWADITDSDEE
jgi:hypothetical protein